MFIIDKHLDHKIMKWPLLGIIAVICLQLVFVAFNALDRSREPVLAVKSVVTGTNAVAGPFGESIDTEDISIATGNRTASRTGKAYASVSNRLRNIEPNYVADKRPAAALYIKTARVNPELVAMERPFESTVVTYPGYPQAIRPVAEADYQMTARIASAESRSFASKTFSVIKKPYKWLKALGSKLD